MVLLGHSDPVKALILLSNGDLVSGSEDYTINIWNIVDGTVKRTLHSHKNHILALQELDNGDLVSGSNDCTIKIWDVEAGTVKKDLTCAKACAFAVLSNGDLVCASKESILIWE
jgi:WD40 repeat protein